MSAPLLDRRHALHVAAGGVLAAALAGPARAQTAFTPERFGAKGDGRTDDSAAFARLSDAVNAAGGGTVVLRRTTYLVGTQSRAPDGGIVEARVMAFAGCTGPLAVHGNGATLRCAAGQRYGMFLAGGAPSPDLPPKGSALMARPYAAMVEARGCSGGVLIEGLELDGQADTLLLGGRPNKKGYQIGCVGVALRDNPGPERLSDIHVHHQPQDGFYIDGPADPTPGVPRLLTGLSADLNGRQGMSIVGGHGYRVERSSFARTARGKVVSAPSAGVDIEAERRKQIRDIAFSDCRFADNRGAGLVADSGDGADVRFTGCTFVGTDNWCAWPNKPGFRFDGCTFVGSLVHPFSDPDPARAARFTACLFTDDPARSPTGRLDFRKSPASILRYADNVLFDRCRFEMGHDGVLPKSKGGPIFRDCIMGQRSPQGVTTEATFEGRTVITGPVELAASAILGPLTLNGAAVPQRSLAQAIAMRAEAAKAHPPRGADDPSD